MSGPCPAGPQDPAELLKQAIQAVLDSEQDGWCVGQFVVVMGLERVTGDGDLESTPWYWCPPLQPEWMTWGLIDAATGLRLVLEDENEE